MVKTAWGAVRTAGLACAIAAACGPALGAGAQRYVRAVTPLLDGAAGKPVGSLAPGAAVEVIGQSGGAVEVAVHGWSAAGRAGTLLAAPDRPVAVLSGFAGQAQAGVSQTVDGTTYTAVTVQGWAPAGALADDVQSVWTAAADLYARSCGSCHALPAPSAYSAAQWPGVMKTQADNANLDPDQAALLTAYLQAQGGR